MQQVNAAVAAGTWPGLPFLYSWGSNGSGQLGLGNTTNYSSPKQVGALAYWDQLSNGQNFSVATKTDGTLWTWGSGGSGVLGLGNVTTHRLNKLVL